MNSYINLDHRTSQNDLMSNILHYYVNMHLPIYHFFFFNNKSTNHLNLYFFEKLNL